jgi:DHA2 family multidrug resistance protein
MMAGLNDRVTGITLGDFAGARGLAGDDVHLLGTVYEATQLAAMPVASWFAATFSLRRFHLAITGIFMLCALLLPLAPSLGWMLAIRALQGLAGGAMIPLLMGSALRFLPPAIKLQGLGFYSLTATFSPNLALWFAASWTDGWNDWRLTSWQVLPIGVLVLGMVFWGIPQDPVRPERMREVDGPGLVAGPLGLMLLAFVAGEGERLDWFHAPLIVGAAIASVALIAAFVLSAWHHPAPFIKLQMVGRRNFALGLPLFMGILIVVIASALLPAAHLAQVQHFRPLQIAPIGLIISLPQIVLAPLVSALLYRRWVDARHVIALGLALIALMLAGVAGDRWLDGAGLLAGPSLPGDRPAAGNRALSLCFGEHTDLACRRGALFGPHQHAQDHGQRAGRGNRRAPAGDRNSGLSGDHRGSRGASGHAQPAPLAETQAITGAVADAYRLAAILAALLIVPTLLLKHVPPPPAGKTA